ncbi:MAG: archaellin/type IV pilin N-terminal domain-containing protein, partial [Candidatus Nanohaloarchaea archaeon]
MKSKGISPLIAAVLLIAFTMAVASLFAQWAPQLIQNAQQGASNTSEEIQSCTGIVLEIKSASTSSGVTVQQVGGDIGVGNVSVTLFYETQDPVQRYITLSGNRDINT